MDENLKTLIDAIGDMHGRGWKLANWQLTHETIEVRDRGELLRQRMHNGKMTIVVNLEHPAEQRRAADALSAAGAVGR